MKTVLKGVVYFFAGQIAVFSVAIFGDQIIWPVEKPDLSTYFQPGDRFASRFEGFDQTVLATDGVWLHTRLDVAPYAPGPPEHFHEAFAETFTVKKGTISILIDGEKRTLRAGESITIPPMARHKPFNETGETVVIESEDPRTLPVEFGFALTQLYGFMDGFENGPPISQMLMRLSVFGEDADSWIAQGPPLIVQKAMRVTMKPVARLAGYKYFDPRFKPTRP
jgi:mannose-6-phosphate isomerase-like protein (cupin superfamily)